MANVYFGVQLAPYRVDYYNILHDRYGFVIYFEQSCFDGQLFDSASLKSSCHYDLTILESRNLFGRHFVKGIMKILKLEKPQFVVVPEFSILAIQVLLARILTGKKFKVISQCDDSFNMVAAGHGFSVIHGMSRKLCMPLLDNIILLDDRSAEWYKMKYGKGIWLPMIQDERNERLQLEMVQLLASDIRRVYNSEGILQLLFVGRLVHLKNLPVLLEACSHLSVPYILLVVGDGPELEAWQELSSLLGVNVVFAGPVHGDKLKAFYYSSDVLVLPSYIEPFGAVVNEALLWGCPCCVSNVAGSRCLISEGKNGYTFNCNDSDDLHLKIESLAKIPRRADRESLMTMDLETSVDRMAISLGFCKRNSVIICSMVRDCASDLSHNIASIESIASRFYDYRVVIFENNSKDSTKRILLDWARSNPKVVVSVNDYDESQYGSIPVSNCYLPFFSMSRIRKYTDYRNMLLDDVCATGFDSDYIMMADLDVASIDIDGVMTCFSADVDWDAVTANGYSRSIGLRRRYHDTYALCELGQENHPQDWETIMSNRIKYAHLRKGMPFVPVFSAYGGLAIFKTQAIKGLRYKVIDNNNGGVQVRCEHFSLFSQMAERGHDKVYINPGMEVLYQRINFKSVLRYFKNRNTLRRFARDVGK